VPCLPQKRGMSAQSPPGEIQAVVARPPPCSARRGRGSNVRQRVTVRLPPRSSSERNAAPRSRHSHRVRPRRRAARKEGSRRAASYARRVWMPQPRLPPQRGNRLRLTGRGSDSTPRAPSQSIRPPVLHPAGMKRRESQPVPRLPSQPPPTLRTPAGGGRQARRPSHAAQTALKARRCTQEAHARQQCFRQQVPAVAEQARQHGAVGSPAAV